MKSRLKEKWEKETRNSVWFTGSNPEFEKIQKKIFGNKEVSKEIKLDYILDSCEETIYTFEKKRGHTLHFITRSFDTNTLEIVIQPVWEMRGFPDENALKVITERSENCIAQNSR
ncbi:MAG: hypothetical protein LH614_10970 [Pyrinomonadaceae bacterium]|nr:hypothetical protein [Pyrinomonadaceae bacterium]